MCTLVHLLSTHWLPMYSYKHSALHTYINTPMHKVYTQTHTDSIHSILRCWHTVRLFSISVHTAPCIRTDKPTVLMLLADRLIQFIQREDTALWTVSITNPRSPLSICLIPWVIWSVEFSVLSLVRLSYLLPILFSPSTTLYSLLPILHPLLFVPSTTLSLLPILHPLLSTLYVKLHKPHY